MYNLSQVCEVGKKYFSTTLATSFNDARLKLFYDDAARYLRLEGKGQNYDAIICGIDILLILL
jgi:spermidine synthase